MNRVTLFEQTFRQLQEDDHEGAARGIRRLLMMLPADHFARPDLLRVLAWAEANARHPR